MPIMGVDPRARLVLDVKCPGSGASGRQVWDNLHHLRPGDEIKFVLASRADYVHFLVEQMDRHGIDVALVGCSADLQVAAAARRDSRRRSALVHCRLNVFVMNTAIWPRVLGLPGQ